MINLTHFYSGLAIVAVVSFGAGTSSFATEEPKAVSVAPIASTVPQPSAKAQEHIMMDHSPGDAKSMRTMKDQTIPVHRAGDPPVKPASTADCKDHIMMDHSAADAKSMRTMKDKAVPIHNRCNPTSKPAAPAKPEAHIMMDHSRADAKSMRHMQDRTVPVHKSGSAEPVETGSPPQK